MNNFRSSFLSNIPPIVKNLIIINVILLLATNLTPGLFLRLGSESNLTDILGMHYWQSSKFSPVQLITYMFMHGGLAHLFFNMLALYMFGGALESFWGPKRFLFFYLVTGIGAGIVQQLFLTFDYNHIISVLNESISSNSASILANHQEVLTVLGHYCQLDNISSKTTLEIIEIKKTFLNSIPPTVGASGSISGLLLAFWWLFPEVKLFVFPIPIPIKARILIPLFALYELYNGFRMNPNDNIAHFAHLGGMLFGAILIIYWKRKNVL
jgi:membrane associated rhomboid family serine protease